MRKHTVGQQWPLLSGSTNTPAFAAGAQVSFQFQDVPDRSPTGPLAYYLPGARVTFKGTIVNSGGTGSSIYSDQFFGALFTSMAWIQAWHGSPLQAQHAVGANWYVMEYVANGQRYESIERGLISNAGNGTYNFEVTIFVPFTSCRYGDLEENTSQLALLARASQLQINCAPASILSGLSTGTTFGTTTVTASAILVPRQDLVLGTPIEPILTQIVAGSGNAVKITNFGTDTGLQGIDPGGGVLALLFLTAQNQQGGSFDTQNITDFTWPWRGQAYTQDVLGLLQGWKRLLKRHEGPSFNVTVGGNTPSIDLYGFPYPLNNNGLFPTSGTANLELKNLLFWALVAPGEEVNLAALQTADSDQTFNMTVTGNYSGTHKILGYYARSWQQGMRNNWLAQVYAGGPGSLAAHVLGQRYGSAKLAQRGPAGIHTISPDQTRYLPWQLFPTG